MLPEENNQMEGRGGHETLADWAAATLWNHPLNYLKYSSQYLIKATQFINYGRQLLSLYL